MGTQDASREVNVSAVRSTAVGKKRVSRKRSAEPSRLRFVGTQVTRERGSNLRIRVELERDGEAYSGDAAGVGLDTVELRLAVDATLAALRRAAPKAPAFRLVGIKRVHAFDADVVLVSLREESGGRLLGAVAVEESLAEGAARAVLDATNRTLGRPSRAGRGEEESE
ncbi:MAG: hypothetical protein ACE5JR_03300 [Gemmatimonadota bacterium]